MAREINYEVSVLETQDTPEDQRTGQEEESDLTEEIDAMRAGGENYTLYAINVYDEDDRRLDLEGCTVLYTKTAGLFGAYYTPNDSGSW